MTLKNLFPLISILTIFNLTVHSQNIIQKADSILTSRFGQDFFKAYIKIDCSRCYCYTSRTNILLKSCSNFDSSCTSYHLLYLINIPEKEIKIETEFIVTKLGDLIDFTVNQSHNLDTMWHSTNLPPLNFLQEQLNFLSRKEIEKIASDRNFPKGIKEWRFGTYFWRKPPDEWYLKNENEKIKKWGKGKFVSSLTSFTSEISLVCISFDAVTGEYLEMVESTGEF